MLVISVSGLTAALANAVFRRRTSSDLVTRYILARSRHCMLNALTTRIPWKDSASLRYISDTWFKPSASCLPALRQTSRTNKMPSGATSNAAIKSRQEISAAPTRQARILIGSRTDWPNSFPKLCCT